MCTVRVMVARRTKGVCPLCQRTMRRGETICWPGRVWVHRDCWLTHRRREKEATQ